LLRNHGTITVGETVGKAYSLTKILEQIAEIRAKIADYGQTKSSAKDE